MKQFIHGFAIKLSKNKKNTFLKKSETKNTQPYILMKFVLVGSYLAAAGFEVPKFTAEYRNNIH
jgi:hypothetical protein